MILAESHFGKVINADRMLKQELGGGTTLDLGIYCIQWASLAFGGERYKRMAYKNVFKIKLPSIKYTRELLVICKLFWYLRPDKITAAGHLNKDDGTGIDTDVSGTLIYKNGGTARFQTHCRVDLNCQATIYGTKGTY